MTILRPNHTDILITDLLKGMQFDIDATIQHFKHHIHFFIESVLLRKKDDRYIKEKIIGFTPIQCSCYSLQNDKVNNSIQYLFISDYILEKLDSIKKTDIQIVSDDDYNVIKVITKDAGITCLENI